MTLVRPEVEALAPYNAGMTLAELVARHRPVRIAKLGSNENPLGPSPRVLEGLTIDSTALRLYPDPAGTALRERLAAGLGVAADRIILGNGSEDLLSVICRAVLRPGDRVVTLYPSFPLHEDYATLQGATVTRIGLRDDLTIDVAGLSEAAAQGPRVVIFANPMNPAGCWLGPEELERVVAATADDTLLVIDEAYIEYAQGPGYGDALERLRDRKRPFVVLRTFSKAWGLAGLRVGYGITHDAGFRDRLDRVRTPFNVNALAQQAALLALDDPSHVEGVVALARDERARLAGFLTACSLTVAPSRGNFLFFDCGRDATEVYDGLLRQGVIVKPWRQPGYTSFLRVSVGSTAENDHFMAVLAMLV